MEPSADVPSEVWRQQLRDGFNAMRLVEAPSVQASARVMSLYAGDVEIMDLRGTPQEVLRTRQSLREAPTERLKVCVQLMGRAVVSQDDREVELLPGDFALYDLSRMYKMRLLTPWRVLIVSFPNESTTLARADIEALRTSKLSMRDGLGSALIGHLQHSLSVGPQCSPLARSSLGTAALSMLDASLRSRVGHAPTPQDDLHDRVLSYIRHHLADPRLNHDSVATAHHVSPRTLHKVFAAYPSTVTQTIRQLRLEAARRDLADPALAYRQVASVARAWCFTDAPHFSRLFKRTFHETPREYRERMTIPAASRA